MPRCPACKIACTPLPYEGVRIYHCGDCGGHWVTETKLGRIVEKRELQMPEAVRQKMMDIADASNRTEKLWCLSCGTEMLKEQFRMWDDIQLDRCPKCDNIWLDRGELEKCQIYWEYLQDHPEEWTGRAAHERAALLEAEFQARKAELSDQADQAANARHYGSGYGLAGSILASIFRGSRW